MSLFKLGVDTGIQAMINLGLTGLSKGWFGDARMGASENHRVEFHAAPKLACKGCRPILEEGGRA